MAESETCLYNKSLACYIVEDKLGILILLVLLPGFEITGMHSGYCISRAACMLGKHFTTAKKECVLTQNFGSRLNK